MSEVTPLSADFQLSVATVEFLKSVVEKCDISAAVSTIILILAESRAGMSLEALGDILDLINGDPELIGGLDMLLEGTLGIIQYGDGTRGVLLRGASNLNMQEVWKSDAGRAARRNNQPASEVGSSPTKKRKVTEKAGAPSKKRGRASRKPPFASGFLAASPVKGVTPKKRGRPPKKPAPGAPLPIVDDLDRKMPAKEDGPAPATAAAAPVDGVTRPKRRGRLPKKGVATSASKGDTPKELGHPPKVASIDGTADERKVPPKTKRGRPRKSPTVEGASPKKRGRPQNSPFAAAKISLDETTLPTSLPAIPSQRMQASAASQGNGNSKTLIPIRYTPQSGKEPEVLSKFIAQKTNFYD